MIDVLSCLPLGYIELIMTAGDDADATRRLLRGKGGEGGSLDGAELDSEEQFNFKTFKTLRLFRLGKLLRIARIKCDLRFSRPHEPRHDHFVFWVVLSMGDKR